MKAYLLWLFFLAPSKGSEPQEVALPASEGVPAAPRHSESTGDHSQDEPRFFKTLFSFNRTPMQTFTKVELEVLEEEMCETMGGTQLKGECLEFIETPKNFEDALGDCRAKGGSLYVPLKHESLFFQKYFLYFRHAFKENLPSLGWVGVRRNGPGAPVLTVQGRDVTREAIYNIFTLTNSECVNIFLTQGDAFLKGEDCSKELPFTCEYVFDSRTKEIFTKRHYSWGQKERNDFGFFNVFKS